MDKKMKTGLILLENSSCNFKSIVENLKKDWDMIIENTLEDGTLSFNIGNNIIEMSLVKSKVSPDVEKSVKNNLFWENGEEKVKNHESYIRLEISGGKDSLKIANLFVKIASVILKLENAIGIYTGVTILEAQMYTEVAAELKNNELPVLDLVFFGFYKTDKGICGYTQGLTFFDKKEIEVIDTEIEFGDLFDFMIDVVYYVITSDVKLCDGETIGFSPEQKLLITLSEGVAVEGPSIKIEVNR